MKKKLLLASVLLTVLGLVAFMGVKTFGRIQHKKQVEVTLQTLPKNTPLLALDSTSISLEGIDTGVVVFFFDPECEHCQSEAEAIKKNTEALAHVRLLWLSAAPFNSLRAFEQRYGLQKNLPNLSIAQLSEQQAYHEFGFRSVPTILIYNAQHQLVKRYSGETKVEAILKYL